MPNALALALTLLAAAAPTPQAAVAAALAQPGGQVEVLGIRVSQGAGCAAEGWEALRPIEASGAAGLRFEGHDPRSVACQGYAWAQVKVLAPSAVTTRALHEGEPLEDAVAVALREVLPGRRPLAGVPAGAVAARPLAAGLPLDPQAIRVGPRAGEPISVVLRVGALSVEQPGRSVPCARDHACALLPSGRRVEGRLEAGRLLVEAP
jgi:hypothetical protein